MRLDKTQTIFLVGLVASAVLVLAFCGGALVMFGNPESAPVAQSEPTATKTKQTVKAAPNLNLLRRQFMNTLTAIGVDSTLIAAVNVVSATDLELTVSNAWHYQPKQIRLQAAQTLWEAWARVASPNELDLARIKLLDLSGNNVGGSGMFAGSIVSVAD